MQHDAIRRIAYRAGRYTKRVAGQLRRQIHDLLGAHHLAAAVFCGPDGELTPQALAWFEHLAEANGVHRAQLLATDREQLWWDARRALVLEIMNSVRLDTGKLNRLRRELNEREVFDDGSGDDSGR